MVNNLLAVKAAYALLNSVETGEGGLVIRSPDMAEILHYSSDLTRLNRMHSSRI